MATDLKQLTPGGKAGPVYETVKMRTKQKSENLHVPRVSKEIQERVESGLKQHTNHWEVNFENWPIAGSLTKEGKFSGKKQVTGSILWNLTYFYVSGLHTLSSYKYQVSGSWPHPGPSRVPGTEQGIF